MSEAVKIIECPRDAWQGLPKVIQAEYLRTLEACALNPEVARFNPGVIQT